jgi:two-component system phosphate regulon sensor histidine kinase PhoR
MLDFRRKDMDAWRDQAKAAEATAGAWLATVGARLSARIPELCAALLIFVLLTLFEALRPLAAIVGMAGLMGIAAIVPLAEVHALDTTPPAAPSVRLPGVDAATIWQTIVDSVPDAAIILDARGIVSFHNARARDLYAGVRVGAPFNGISRNPELHAAIDRAAATGERVKAEVVERVPLERRFDATVASLQAAERALLRHDADAPQLLVTLRDRTEEDRLASMRADFIANASHELRTPLASLRGFIETLQGPAREDVAARERFLGLMHAQATRMTRLIDDLLSLSRAQMNAHVPPRGTVDLNEVASHVGETMQPIAAEARIAIAVERLPGPARITGERDQIVQLASNLVQNAIKYGHAGGHVRISVARTETGDGPEKLALSVADDGPGIAPEHIPRLTERFYRVSVASSRDKGGTGLGLAIVKHIVGRHRGELKIASRLGEGSTFSAVFDELKP